MSGLSPRACSQFYCSPAASASDGGANVEPTRYPDEPSLDGHAPGRALAERLGLGGGESSSVLFGEPMVCDAFLFSPCGFSANLISAGGGGRYATFHVTPEEGWSYASFECNIDFSGASTVEEPNSEAEKRSGAQGIKMLVRRIVDVFEPRRMSLTLFVSQEEGRSNDEDDEDDAKSGEDVAGKEVGDDGEETGPTEGAIHEGFKTVLSKDLVKGYRRTDRIVYEFEGCVEWSPLISTLS